MASEWRKALDKARKADKAPAPSSTAPPATKSTTRKKVGRKK